MNADFWLADSSVEMPSDMTCSLSPARAAFPCPHSVHVTVCDVSGAIQSAVLASVNATDSLYVSGLDISSTIQSPIVWSVNMTECLYVAVLGILSPTDSAIASLDFSGSFHWRVSQN